jgi:hypothetical protein
MRLRLAGNLEQVRRKRNAYRILVGKREGKRTLRRQRRRWMNYIKMNLREIRLCGMDWIGLAQEGFFEHCNEPSGFRTILGNS